MDFEKPSRKSKPRLQKYLAECGFGSRRACEELIVSGLVSVDGQITTELGTQVDPRLQQIQVRGRPAQLEPRFTAMIYKPPGVICSSQDPHGRKTVLDLFASPPARLYTVGRLDYQSEGLLLVTNEGELAHRLTHPRYHIEKEYRVRLSRPLSEKEKNRLCSGIEEGGEFLRAVSIQPGRMPSETLWILKEGKNRQIRRMASVLGADVIRLERVRLGELKIANLRPGSWRELTSKEKGMLEQAVGL